MLSPSSPAAAAAPAAGERIMSAGSFASLACRWMGDLPNT